MQLLARSFRGQNFGKRRDIKRDKNPWQLRPKILEFLDLFSFKTSGVKNG